MGWTIAIIVVAIILACMDSALGKVALGAGVVAIGFLLLDWITDIGIFVVLSKVCAVVIVLIILWAILAAIFG